MGGIVGFKFSGFCTVDSSCSGSYVCGRLSHW